jgi:uncharacterized protein YceK
MKYKSIILFLVIFQFTCATIYTVPHWFEKDAPILYSGARCDYGLIEEYGIKNDPILILDLPFSFFLDTVLLPLSLPIAFGLSRSRGQIGFSSYCPE